MNVSMSAASLFSDQAAIVTGAASGIGAGVARQLAKAGATVVVADVQDDKGAALADEIGGAFAHVDVTDTAQIEAAVDRATELGELRIVVNSAGIGPAARTVGWCRNYADSDWTAPCRFSMTCRVSVGQAAPPGRETAPRCSRRSPDR